MVCEDCMRHKAMIRTLIVRLQKARQEIQYLEDTLDGWWNPPTTYTIATVEPPKYVQGRLYDAGTDPST